MTKVIAITQARTGSTRLPSKVLKTISGKTLLEIHLERLKKCKTISDLIVATTTESEDEKIVEIAQKVGLSYYRGSQNDVLDRFYQAAKPYSPDFVVRVTSDCPLIDPILIDNIVDYTINSGLDYVSNVIEQSGYPDGQDIEVFSYVALNEAWENAKLKSEREHVTPYIRNNSSYFGKNLFKSSGYPSPDDYTDVRLTVDEPQDFEVIKLIIEKLGSDKSWLEYTNYYLESKFKDINGSFERAEGYKKSLLKD
jgi:spore coat polysaccharide biosynthesis protein SpsF (cytidylyltransferase family)